MRLFFVHVLGVWPETVHSRRRARVQQSREWCTDGVAVSSCAPGPLGPVLAFRGEIEAQGRGTLHPHILVWLAMVFQLELLLRILARQPALFKASRALWMKEMVRAVQSTCQTSVKALPRQFSHTTSQLQDLPFSRADRRITEFDGGSKLDALAAAAARGFALSETQEAAIEGGDHDAWRRPCLATRDKAGVETAGNAAEPPRESVYGERLSEFAASACPAYRRLGVCRATTRSADVCDHPDTATTSAGGAGAEEISPLDADTWESRFGDDLRRLATEIPIHICGESCYKYTRAKLTQICRHGFYYVI